MYFQLQNLKLDMWKIDEYIAEFFRLVALVDLREYDIHPVLQFSRCMRDQFWNTFNFFDSVNVSWVQETSRGHHSGGISS